MNKYLVFTAVLASTLLAGCHHWYQKRFTALHPECPPGETVGSTLMPSVVHVEGCGFTENFHFAFVGATRPLAEASAADRASFELSCPREQLILTTLAHGQVGISGCGQQVVYIQSGNAWAANNVTPSPVTPP